MTLLVLLPGCWTGVSVLVSQDGGTTNDGSVTDARVDATPIDAEAPDGGVGDAGPPDLETCDGRARAECEWFQRCGGNLFVVAYFRDGLAGCISQRRTACQGLLRNVPAIRPADPAACTRATIASCDAFHDPVPVHRRPPLPECATPSVATRLEGESCFSNSQCAQVDGRPMRCVSFADSEGYCAGLCRRTVSAGTACGAEDFCDPTNGGECMYGYDASAANRRNRDYRCRVPDRTGTLGAACSDATERQCMDGLVCNVEGHCAPPLGVGDLCGSSRIAVTAHCEDVNPNLACVHESGVFFGTCVDRTDAYVEAGERCDIRPGTLCPNGVECPPSGVCDSSGVALDAACDASAPWCVFGQVCVAGRCVDREPEDCRVF